MANHEQIIETIKEMSVLELNDDAAAEKTEFDVELTSAGSSKIKVVTDVKEVTGLGLKDAKELVDGAPKVIKEALPKEEAEKLKEQLEEVGATVELK